MSSIPTPLERLWRVRKDHTWIDAQIRAEDGGVEVHFFYDGECVVSRTFDTREAAVASAQSTLVELQRAGWASHW